MLDDLEKSMHRISGEFKEFQSRLLEENLTKQLVKRADELYKSESPKEIHQLTTAVDYLECHGRQLKIGARGSTETEE